MKRVLGLNESTMRYHLEFLEKKKNIHVKIERATGAISPEDAPRMLPVGP